MPMLSLIFLQHGKTLGGHMRHLKTIITCRMRQKHLETVKTSLDKLEGREVDLVELGGVITIVDHKTSLPLSTRQFTDIYTAKEYTKQRGFILC